MPRKITIKNLRHISNLEFEIPRRGVWLLTGANGTGKTSLLGCLRRIGFSNAFPIHFPASRMSDRLDSYEGASVTYETPGGAVTYTYRTERWVPTPRANSRVLETLGYPDVVYVAANADRIEPRKEDFSPRKVRAAPQELITAANQIFSSAKFDVLKTINVRKGVGNQAFLLELPTGNKQGKHYFSEKNLSLGELCILKLLRMLADCRQGSLILVDELELALHPTAQAELLRYLQQIADDKNLTIVVSTHSSTLIKQAPRDRILLLQADGDGAVSCTSRCFPSFVLGALAYREEAASDVVIYVEDDAARAIVEQLARRFIADQYQINSLVPSVSVVPVGGITNVLRFFTRQRPLLPAITRAFVVLDADAQATLDAARAEDIVRIYRDERRAISFLPFTPEVGLAQYLNASREQALAQLRQHFLFNTLTLRRADIGPVPADNAANLRDDCKRIVDEVCDRLSAQLPNASSDDVRLVLFKLLAEHTYVTNRPGVMQQFGPIIRG
ncbi:AAA ATPase domain protein [Burkholderia cenocepacia]|uniref:AAA ATPase domain protein n=1 Tax=Burkholderia cenocepacia TaxID=95486 RepID=A0AAN0RSU5_9BURK|nr:AAA ATPase domain protein [Burkholderia cenocepacia]